MDQDIQKKFEEQEAKLDAIYKSIEKMRKYFLWTLYVTIATIILPIIGLIVIIPWFMRIMSSAYGGLL
jgi:hypothetical protein